MQKDTIAAIATGMSQAGIGIIRISGPEAISAADRLYRSKCGKKRLAESASHTIHYGYIYDGGQLLDEVLVSVMKGPHSYTGEDTVEINCHGGILVVKRILEAVLKTEVRPADPGEFTKRAFLNGRPDLSQAEAVIDVINSRNDFALKSSVSQLKGSLSGKIREVREKLLYQIAFIESALDDPEHISLDGYPEQLLDTINPLALQLSELLKSYDNGHILSDGIKTVILGKPNAGKSSLLNILAGRERAIVTDIAGTTRDILEEQIILDGIGISLVDTAGIRKTEDAVEKIGVSRAKDQAKDADLIIYVVDSSVPLDENDLEIIELIQNRKSIVLLNKSDLETYVSVEELQDRTDKKVISVSARENTGIEALTEAIKEMFYSGDVSINEELYITNERHKIALQNAYKSLELVKSSIEGGLPEDFFSIDLMDAYEQLGVILGESVEEDLVNEIFSKFCMGK